MLDIKSPSPSASINSTDRDGEAIIVIKNINLLTAVGWNENANLTIKDGVIQEISVDPASGDIEIDGQGRYALPGIVDIHGDAFERDIIPRAGVEFDIELALQSNDANLISSGITTFYYSITDGFESGLRSRETVRVIMEVLDKLRDRLLSDSKIHIRHEQANTENHAELISWMEEGRVDLISLNNHLPSSVNEKAIVKYCKAIQRRETITEEDARVFIMEMQSRIPEGAQQIDELAALSKKLGLPVASHDDATQEDFKNALDRSVNIAEFPLDDDVARELKANDIKILMGAPNGVRGKSHINGTTVREAVKEGLVDVLCSDYHYPSLLRIPFLLTELGLLEIWDAFNLVSLNPAIAAGLGTTKGSLEAGKQADILLMNNLSGHSLDIDLVMVGGKVVLNRNIR